MPYVLRDRKLERDFQKELIKELKLIFPGCYVLKMDGSNVPQGFPDLLILYRDRWAFLECKRCETAHRENHQDYYVNILNELSFASFIFPDNKEEVLNDLKQALGVG